PTRGRGISHSLFHEKSLAQPRAIFTRLVSASNEKSVLRKLRAGNPASKDDRSEDLCLRKPAPSPGQARRAPTPPNQRAVSGSVCYYDPKPCEGSRVRRVG